MPRTLGDRRPRPVCCSCPACAVKGAPRRPPSDLTASWPPGVRPRQAQRRGGSEVLRHPTRPWPPHVPESPSHPSRVSRCFQMCKSRRPRCSARVALTLVASPGHAVPQGPRRSAGRPHPSPSRGAAQPQPAKESPAGPPSPCKPESLGGLPHGPVVAGPHRLCPVSPGLAGGSPPSWSAGRSPCSGARRPGERGAQVTPEPRVQAPGLFRLERGHVIWP